MRARPLAGRRVVVTRAPHQAGELTAALADAGARVVCLPLLEVVPPADVAPLVSAVRHATDFDWLAFTSTNAVDAFFAQAPPAPLPPIAAVGPATAAALRRHGAEPRVVATSSRAEGLVEALGPRLDKGDRVLVPQAGDARPALVQGLEDLGARVVAVVAYEKRLPEGSADAARRLFAKEPLGWVTFTSPRVVRDFRQLLGEAWDGRRGELRALSIGPVTSAELRRHRVDPAAEAERPEPEAIVRAMIEAS